MKYKVMIVEDQTMPRELIELRIQSPSILRRRFPSTTPRWRRYTACASRWI